MKHAEVSCYGSQAIRCAILAGDTNVLETLVRQSADPNSRVTGLGHLGYSDTLTLLMVAVYACADAPRLVSRIMFLVGAFARTAFE